MRNHTVAVWMPRRTNASQARIVLPSSQVFLQPDDGFDTRAFDPRAQRVIYEYDRVDAPNDRALPERLVRFFIEQVRRYAAASDRTQRAMRQIRARFMAGEEPAKLDSAVTKLMVDLNSRHAPPEEVRAVQALQHEMRLDDARR